MKLGFIGARNMAKAMIGGILKNNIFKPEEVIASDLYEPGLRQAKESLGIHVTTDNKEVASSTEIASFSFTIGTTFIRSSSSNVFLASCLHSLLIMDSFVSNTCAVN